MSRKRESKKYGNFLMPSDIPEKTTKKRPGYMSPLYVRHSMELTGGTRARRRTRSHFFDVEREYGDIIDDTDSELSDAFYSDSTYHASECGELTDHSDTEIPFTRRKQKKQQSLKSNFLEKACLTDTDEENVKRAVPPRRKKSSIRNKSRTESVENNEHSWTDSGVSLSRTDYSRNGTLCDTVSQKRIMQEYALQKNRSGSVPCDRLLSKDKADIRRRVFSQSDAKTSIPVIKVDQQNITTENKLNRCSVITDRSSLTNVTNLSINDLTAVSSESNSEVKIDQITPAQIIPETESVLSDPPNSNLEKVSVPADAPKSQDDTSTSEQGYSEKTDQPPATEFIQSSEINSAVSSGNHEINIQINAILGNGFQNKTEENKNTDSFNFINTDGTGKSSGRKKSKNLMSGLRKFAVNLRPKFLRPQKKHFKDMNSNMFVANEEKRIQRDSKIVHNKSVVDDRISSGSEIYPHYSGFATLESFANRKSTKSRRLFDRIFPRSRSFSAEKIVQQKLTRKGSLPPNMSTYNSKLTPNQRTSKSLENIGFGANYYNRNSVENLRSFNEPVIGSHISRVHSMNQLNTFENIYSKARANSTPVTPLMMHKNQNAPEICNCEDCVYEEYLEYLAFQEFRRNKNRTHQIHHFTEREHSVHSLPYITHISSPHTPVNGTHAQFEGVVAPLDISHGQEKEARTLRTSLYDTFV